MTRKDIKTKYNFIGENKDIMLFRKQGEYTYGIGYCGNIALKNGKAVFNGKSYSDLETLDKALVEWEKSLPYPVDTYCPMTRESYRVESQIEWYLTNNLGFVSKTSEWHHRYAREMGPAFELSFKVEQDTEKECVRIFSSFGGVTFTQEVTDTETGVAIVSAIVNGECLCMAKDMVDLISACNEEVNGEIEAYVPTKQNIFGVAKTSFKEVMIDRLEKVLAQLKGE